MEASTAAAFLHENMLEFIDAEAIEDAASACLYLSHSGELAKLPGSLCSSLAPTLHSYYKCLSVSQPFR